MGILNFYLVRTDYVSEKELTISFGELKSLYTSNL